MDSFDNYLKRLNKDGENFQQRILTRREKKFDNFLKRSIYRSDTLTDENGEHYLGAIHPTKDSEKTCIYTLMTKKDTVFAPGQIITDKGKTWLITHKVLDDTLGYNCYSTMYLPLTLTIEKGEEKISFPARITNDSAEEIEDFFSTLSRTSRQYREPDRNIKAICKKYDFLEKDLKFEIEGDSYKIEGINKTAVPGCVYLTLGQCLTDGAKNDGDADDTNNSFWGDI